jgi:hypothetical protein
MLQWLFVHLKRLRDRHIVKRYIQAGNDFGEALSYVPLVGKCVGYSNLERTWARAEKAYASLGYRTVPIDEFHDSGGYGKSIDHLFCIRRNPDELPVFYADKK